MDTLYAGLMHLMDIIPNFIGAAVHWCCVAVSLCRACMVIVQVLSGNRYQQEVQGTLSCLALMNLFRGD